MQQDLNSISSDASNNPDNLALDGSQLEGDMDDPVNLTGPGDFEELAEMIGNEGFELVGAPVTIEPSAGAATGVKDPHRSPAERHH